jgi:septum formation protein
MPLGPSQDRALILASASPTRLAMLNGAGLVVSSRPARIDEASIRAAMTEEGASPQDQADALAEHKARKIAQRDPLALVLGADQILSLKGAVFAKPETPDEARAQLLTLRGQTHHLHSAAVLYDQGAPVWRHVSTARLTMRPFSEAYLDAYLSRNWPAISGAVGGYLIEAEGIRLFDHIEGDHFTILGLPLLPLLAYLGLRGLIPS